jgi:hypothetical protein
MQDAQERTERLASMLVDSRKRTLELVSDLSDEQMIGPQLRIVNPPLWEIGHLAWFQERWNLRRLTDEDFLPSSILERGDEFSGHPGQLVRSRSWVTHGRMLRNTWRNFATPDRRDLFVGFRTCALE